MLVGTLTPVITEMQTLQAADPGSVAAARAKLINDLSDAIASAVSNYLRTSVLTIPLPTGPAPGPVTHIHPNIAHKLNPLG